MVMFIISFDIPYYCPINEDILKSIYNEELLHINYKIKGHHISFDSYSFHYANYRLVFSLLIMFFSINI